MTRLAPGPAVWTPPLEAGPLRDLLNRLQAWRPLDQAEVLADVAAAVDGAPLAADEAELVGGRLAYWLERFADIAVSTGAARKSPYIGDLQRQARLLLRRLDCGARSDRWQLLPQLGWYAGELLEQLVSSHCIKEEL